MKEAERSLKSGILFQKNVYQNKSSFFNNQDQDNEKGDFDIALEKQNNNNNINVNNNDDLVHAALEQDDDEEDDDDVENVNNPMYNQENRKSKVKQYNQSNSLNKNHDTCSDLCSGLVVTLHNPSQLDEHDHHYFKSTEALIVCVVSRRHLLPFNPTFSTHSHNNSQEVNSKVNNLNNNQLIDNDNHDNNNTKKDKVHFQQPQQKYHGLRVLSGNILTAIRSECYNEILEPELWYKNYILLPPKQIVRAFQLKEIDDQNINEKDNLMNNPYLQFGISSLMASKQKQRNKENKNEEEEDIDKNNEKLKEQERNGTNKEDDEREGNHPQTSKSSAVISGAAVSENQDVNDELESALKDGSPLNGNISPTILKPETIEQYVNAMKRIRKICEDNKWVILYHYTQSAFGSMIAKTGFRMSTQGQGDGGVYFSTKGPTSYDWGSDKYEKNLINDCYGEGRLKEYLGKNLLDLLIVYGTDPELLRPAPGGRDNAVMVSKADFETLSYPHNDGNYFLRPDRILGMFYLPTYIQNTNDDDDANDDNNNKNNDDEDVNNEKVDQNNDNNDISDMNTTNSNNSILQTVRNISIANLTASINYNKNSHKNDHDICLKLNKEELYYLIKLEKENMT
eukprot:CAMPEP_0114337352 /NCGR_PEP_ID=MMETSP0101-20121206/6308_1 /TAXON_ID=38822 ORGANISM="Pteridomonas danica, Strain PT" /NCGR_SAMPLE_ID=MMETSP0101 /ASSEMBLY_ACC=CAM_ASM_000211 /LENGTH=623 /DNA_ID=CAMNT_0001469563 /DNA_START=199 /DNA_END=2070 /DNA_ORIENTATION=+